MGTQYDNSPRGRGIYLLPNLFTLTALFAGFYAIITAMKGHFDNAAIAIFIAMIMDTLDGRVARFTHTQTEFGAQLDSLSDMVSFGLAPALILYSWGLNTLSKAGWLVTFIYAACVALRLARFNVQHNMLDKRYFKGLPCPAGAAIIASLIWSTSQNELNSATIHIITAILTVIVSLLMVSNLLFYSFKDFNLKNKVPFIVILLVVLIYVLISVDPPSILFIISLGYALSGPLFYVWRWRRSNTPKRKPKNDI